MKSNLSVHLSYDPLSLFLYLHFYVSLYLSTHILSFSSLSMRLTSHPHSLFYLFIFLSSSHLLLFLPPSLCLSFSHPLSLSDSPFLTYIFLPSYLYLSCSVPPTFFLFLHLWRPHPSPSLSRSFSPSRLRRQYESTSEDRLGRPQFPHGTEHIIYFTFYDFLHEVSYFIASEWPLSHSHAVSFALCFTTVSTCLYFLVLFIFIFWWSLQGICER